MIAGDQSQRALSTSLKEVERTASFKPRTIPYSNSPQPNMLTVPTLGDFKLPNIDNEPMVCDQC